jgi:hypothetical protein
LLDDIFTSLLSLIYLQQLGKLTKFGCAYYFPTVPAITCNASTDRTIARYGI